MCLYLEQNDTYYSREGTPVSAPIRGYVRQMWGGYVQSKRKHPSQNTKTKTTLLSSGHAPTPSWVYLANKRLKKEILAPAPGTSRVGELNPRRKDPNSSWNKSNRDKSVSAEETLERYAHVSNQALQGGRLIAKILTIKPNRCTKFSNLFLE